MGLQALVAAILIATLVVQAARPDVRLLVVTAGAALSALAVSVPGLATPKALLADVPWDVLVILVALALLTELFVKSRVFGVIAVRSARRSGGDPRLLIALYAVGMYVVSCLANNVAALLLVLPIMLVQLKLFGVNQRYLSWALGVLLVACNLGGAATPIGDFPAILLLGRGSLGFTEYLVNAAPPTLIGLAVLIAFALVVARPERGLDRDPMAARISTAVMEALYRNVEVDRRVLGPPLVILVLMLVAWIVVPPESGFTPELICWIGVAAALLLQPRTGEQLVRTRVDVEAVLFLLLLFVMVAAVRRTGIFESISAALSSMPVSATVQLVAFLLIAGVVTGIFSAGPSMAAMLDVADVLARRLPPTSVYVGLALSVCAGSSLFLTAATSGPLAQALAERADLRDEQGQRLQFGFHDFLPVGLVSFAIIEAIAIAYALATARFA